MLKDISQLFGPIPSYSYMPGVYKEENQSYFSKAISLCQESNMFCRKTLLGIGENEMVVREFFDNSTIVSIIKAIIDIFIQNIKELVEHFLNAMGVFTKGEAHIEKYASQILKFDGVLRIEDFYHYKYTNLEADIPPLDINKQILSEYDRLVDKLKKIGREKYRDDLIKSLNTFAIESKRDFKDKDIFLLRGRIVNKRHGCSRELYSEELYKIFRNGKTAGELGEIHQEEIHEAYRRWKNGDIFEKDIKHQRKIIEANAAEIKKRIRNIDLALVTNGNYTSDYDLDNLLNNIIRIECDKIQEICNTTVLAFGTKLDALKEALIQDKKVLYYTISEIIKAG